MYEKDYIMRLIKEMIRTIVKLLFDIDMEKPTGHILENIEAENQLKKLLDMIEQGKINEAENEVYAMTENGDQEDIKSALLFYAYLNEKEDDFLAEHNFSRREIKAGLRRVAAKCGVAGLYEAFWADEDLECIE